ncbi:MAG TPA: PspC domain-containing protein [bacterium]|nr:PspC domain-containing protein [bacterium]HPN34724.1 PspC domain-containing protein [bacterium]
MNTTAPQRRLYRSRRHKVIAGVCGGFAEYTGLDTSLVRVFWLLAALFNGAGILAYFVCLFIMKENPQDTIEETPSAVVEKRRPEWTIGLILTIIGAVLLLHNLTGHEWWLPWRWFEILNIHIREVWPVLLIALGMAILLRHPQSDDPTKTNSEPASRLYRCQKDRMIGGVCSGLAAYWQIDVTLVRIIWILTSLLGSLAAGGLAYLLLLVLIPEKPQAEEQIAQP